jgi:tellurite resistance protein
MHPSELIHEHVSAVQHLWYGHGNVPSKNDFEFSWKAVKAVAAADGELSEAERLHLLGKMCAILTPPDIVEVVMTFDEGSEAPERLLARVNVPAEVRAGAGAWIVYEALSAAIADGELASEEVQAVRRAGASMGVKPETVDALLGLCRTEASLRARRIELLQSTIETPFRFDHGASTRAEAATASAERSEM